MSTSTSTPKKPPPPPPPPPIHSTFSATQIPTLTTNNTHPHPHQHPPSHLLHQRADSPKRSISYATTPTHSSTPVANASASLSSAAATPASSSIATTTTSSSARKAKEKHDDLTCDHKVKGALTELLNDGSVKADAPGRRSVQKLLMETERELRSQRRESLGGRRSRRGSLGLGSGNEDGEDEGKRR